MEILGFYDEPYRIQGERASIPPPMTTAARPVDPPAVAPARDTSKPLIASLWEQIDIGETLLDWTPTVIARRKLGGRTLSTGVIVTSLVLSAVLSAVLWFVLQRGPRIEAVAESAFTQAVTEVDDSASNLKGVATSLGAADAPDLSEASAALLDVEDDARSLFSLAGELPDDDPRRAAAVATSGTILESASRTSRLLAYRLAAEQILVPPVLPTDPSATDLAGATERATAWRANAQSALDDLPAGTLDAHRRLMDGWVDGLEPWQVSYLDGVRNGDTVAMASAVTAASAHIEELRSNLLNRLDEVGGEIAGEVDGALSTTERLLGA